MDIQDFQLSILDVAQDVLSGGLSYHDACDEYDLDYGQARELSQVLTAEGYFG